MHKMKEEVRVLTHSGRQVTTVVVMTVIRHACAWGTIAHGPPKIGASERYDISSTSSMYVRARHKFLLIRIHVVLLLTLSQQFPVDCCNSQGV